MFVRDNAPRLSVEIEEEQFDALQRLIPRGLKKQLFHVIINDLIRILEKAPKREIVIAAIIGRLINVPEIVLRMDHEEGE
jgi:hypothetical protein